MSTPIDQMIQDLVQNDLGRRSEEKQLRLRERERNSRTALDPNFSYFDPDRYSLLDTDTVYDRNTGKKIRLSGGKGTFADAFETDIAQYERDPARARAHRQAYARQFGRDVNDISNEDLVDAGLAQTAAMAERLESLRGKGMGFTITGEDEYGRQIGQFDDNSILEPILGTEGNAGYFSQYNYKRVREDVAAIRAGKEDELAHPDRSLLETAADQLVNVGVETGRLAANLTQGFLQPFVSAATEGEGSETLDNFFQYLQRGFDGTKELLNSEGQKARQRFDQKESALLRPLFNLRKEQWLKNNPDKPEWQGSLSAITDEAFDRIEYLIEEPGRILDASFESLPYMIGVGAAGRAMTLKKTEQLRGQFLARVKKDANLRRKADGTFDTTRAALNKHLNSKPIQNAIRKTQRRTGVTAVALSEGLTNATDVYNSVSSMGEEEARQSEKYNALRSRGLSHRQATAKLASKAFTETFAMTTIIAGAASFATGAGTFEASLFTRLGNRTRGKISADNALLKYGQATGRAVGSFTGPGSREAVEETAQSGGGEFISQLAEFRATGLGEVGPGVGTAAGEGAAVGFVSGAVAGGAGTVVKGTVLAGKAAADALSKTNTGGLDSAQIITPITDDNGTVGGKVVDARAEATKQKAEGRTTLETLNDALDALDGSDPNAQILVSHIRTFHGNVLMDPAISEEEKDKVSKRAADILELAGIEATAQANELLAKYKDNPEVIADSKEMLQIISMARTYGIESIEVPPVLNKYFAAEDVVNDTLDEAEAAVRESTIIPEGKTQDQVVEEKMGEGYGPTGPGLKAHAAEIQEAIRNNDQQEYARKDAALATFMKGQQNKVNALREMARRIMNQGQPIAQTEREVNGKYGTDLKWVPPNEDLMKFNRENNLTGEDARWSGSLLLGIEIANELKAMVKVRAALAEQAKIWNKDSTEIAETADTAIKESDPDAQPSPFIIEDSGRSGEAGSTSESRDEVNEETETGSAEGRGSPTPTTSKTSNETSEAPAGTQSDVTEDNNQPEDSGAASRPGPSARTEVEDDGGEQGGSEATDAAREPESEDSAPNIEDLGFQIEDEEDSSVPTLGQLTGADPENEAEAVPTLEEVESTEASESPQEATEEAEAAEPPLKKTLTGEALEIARTSIYELERAIKNADAFKNVDQLRLSNGKLMDAMRAYMENNPKPEGQEWTVQEIAEIYLDKFEKGYTSEVFDVPAQPELTEEANEVLDTTEQLILGKKVKSTILSSFEPAVDLLSDTATRLLAYWVGERKPLATWTEDDLERVRNAIKDKLKAVGLPQSIRKVLRLRSEKTSNLLSAAGNVFGLLNNVHTRRAFSRRVGANAREEQSINGVVDFVNRFVTALQDPDIGIALGSINDAGHKNSPFGAKKVGKDGIAVTNRLHEYALQFLFNEDTGQLNPNLAAIMAIEAGQWLATAGAATLVNLESTINELIGNPDGTEIHPDAYRAFGQGTLTSNVVSSIGQRVLSQANLSLNGKGIDPLFLDELHSSIGTMALATLSKMDLVQIRPVEANVRAKFQVANEAQESGNETLNLVFVTPAGESRELRHQESAPNKDARLAFTGAGRVLNKVFSAAAYVRGPVLEAPKAPTMVSRANSEIPVAQQKNMEGNSKFAWRPIKGAVEFLDRFGDDETFGRFFMGTQDSEQVHITEREAVESKNAQNRRSLSHIREWVGANGSRPFYFAYKMIRSGRIYIDSNTVNPQQDKLHRFMFAMEDWGVEMSTRSLNPRGAKYENFLIAVALGLGIDSSTKKRSVVLAEVQAKLEEKDVLKAIELLKEDRQYTEDEMAAIAQVLKEDEEVHGLMALKAWADYKKAQETPGVNQITIHLPMETDGKTNGFASGLLQTPTLNKEDRAIIKQLLRATGVYFKDDDFVNYPGFSDPSKGNQDNYEGVATETNSIAQAFRNGKIAGLSSPPPKEREKALLRIQRSRKSVELIMNGSFIKLDRNFAKTPLMVVAYGAGYASIRRAVVNKALRDFYKDLQRAQTPEEAARVLVSLRQVVDGANNHYTRDYDALYEKQVASFKKGKDWKQRSLNWEMSAADETSFRDAHDAIYGHALQRALENKLGPIQTVRQRLNEANYLMNLIFTRNFRRAIAQQERIKKRPLAERERQVVLNRMIKQGLVPMIRSPLSRNQLDSITTTSDGTIVIGRQVNKDGKTIAPGRKGRAYFRSPQNIRKKTWALNDAGKLYEKDTGNVESMVGALTGYAPNMDVGVSALVNMIHSSDGAVNGRVMRKNAMLNVHDAQIGNFNDIDRIAHEANQAFYEAHRNWNLAQETFDSLFRMLPLLEGTDPRLSKAEKAEIDAEFLKYRMKFGGVPVGTDLSLATKSRDRWFQAFQEVVNETNEARVILFDEISHVNQFAKQGTDSQQVQYRVGSNTKGVVNPKAAEVLAQATTIEGVLNIVREEEANVWQQKKLEVIRELTEARNNGGDIRAVLNDWMRQSGIGHSPAAEDMLDVLFAVFQDDFTNERHLDNFRDMITLLRPMLQQRDPVTKKRQRVYVRLGDATQMDKVQGMYVPDAGHILINPNNSNPVEFILHEIIHAANVKQLEHLQAEETDTFSELLKETKDWIKEQKKSKEGLRVTTLLKAIQANKDLAASEKEVRLVTEYVAYLNATQRVNQDGSRAFVFNRRMTDSVNALARSLESKSGNNVFYSSSESTTRSLFDKVAPEQLTSDSVLEIFEKVKQLESTPVDSATQKVFDRILSQWIKPGLASIDNVIVKMAQSSTGKRNLGMWLEDPTQSQIFLQATRQNYYNSPVEQSLQEVALHEMLHAIFEYALTHDDFIIREVEKVFNNVQQQLTETYGISNEWMVFLPPEATTWSDLDNKLAKKQYEHIFENGKSSLHEFMAMGLTNPRFMDILADLNNEPPKVIRDGTILGTLANLLERAIHFIRTEVLNKAATTPSEDLQRLASKIIKLNAQNKALAEKAADQGWLTKKLDSLNDAALRKMASITNSKLQQWAEANSRSGDSLAQELEGKGALGKLVAASKVATASTLDKDALQGFRDAFESALTGIKKDHPLYQMLTEVLPWADRNRSWIDVLRRSERLIDMMREQKFQHTRSALKSYFDPSLKLTREMRENMTRVLIETDVISLTSGDNAITMGDLLNLLKSPQQVQSMIDALTQELQNNTTANAFRLFDVQSEALAEFMVSGRATTRGMGLNAHVIVKQFMLDEKAREPIEDETRVIDLVDRLTSLRAFQRVQGEAANNVLEIMTNEMDRAVTINGFTGLLGTHGTFKRLALEKLFENDPTQMMKGYTADVTDSEIEIKAVEDTGGNREAMRKKGFQYIKDLARDELDPGPKMLLYKRKRGINQFSKSIMSLTGQQKAGTGMFDSMFATAPVLESQKVTAARAYNRIAATEATIKQEVEQQMNGAKLTTKAVNLIPLYNQKGEMVDFRYVMEKANKREHLKKRDMFDEVLPRMMASIEDRTNTKVINHEAIDLLYDEFLEARKNKTFEDGLINQEDTRFVKIGPKVASERGRELWNLLPKETKLYAREKFGADVLYLRDDVVNLVLGFRKVAWSDNKFLAPGAPVLDVAEKIWLEVMQWVRFRIAVLTPAVVIGNIVSNFALLLSQGIPPQYIVRESKKAIIAMRKYQKDLRTRNELSLTVENLRAEGKNAVALEQRVIRLDHQLETNVVAPLVQEGMFTSIVEEFGIDEDSIRRQGTTKFLDKFGGITGSETIVKVAQEAFMVPGSETAAMALMATQYGDFVGRFVQFNWQTKVKKVPKRQAVHNALDAFIYYNVPQNRWLQFLNDNGLMMFTKFFFRIQHIIGRVFKQNPVQASLTLGFQEMAGGLTGSRAAEENISMYAFMQNLTRKFKITPWEHVTNGELFIPTFLKWIPEVFYGD